MEGIEQHLCEFEHKRLDRVLHIWKPSHSVGRWDEECLEWRHRIGREPKDLQIRGERSVPCPSATQSCSTTHHRIVENVGGCFVSIMSTQGGYGHLCLHQEMECTLKSSFPSRQDLRAFLHTCSRRRTVSGKMCDRSRGSALVPSRRQANKLILPSCLSLNRLYTLSSRAL